MRALVVGAEGQLGFALLGRLRELGHAVVGLGRALDISDLGRVRGELTGRRGGGPEIVINAAAARDVDRCEREPEQAFAANSRGPANLASVCEDIGARFVHVSTDFVFSGSLGRAYTEEDPAEPLNTYGRSKLEGEGRVLEECAGALVVRTAWLYGGRGRNFASWLLERAREPEEIRIATDQMGSPTYVMDLVEGLISLVERESAGLYHLANEGVATRFEFARAVLDGSSWSERQLLPAQLADFPSDAPRPLNTALDCSRAAGAGVRLRPWQAAVEAFSSGCRTSD